MFELFFFKTFASALILLLILYFSFKILGRPSIVSKFNWTKTLNSTLFKLVQNLGAFIWRETIRNESAPNVFVLFIHRKPFRVSLFPLNASSEISIISPGTCFWTQIQERGCSLSWFLTLYRQSLPQRSRTKMPMRYCGFYTSLHSRVHCSVYHSVRGGSGKNEERWLWNSLCIAL